MAESRNENNRAPIQQARIQAGLRYADHEIISIFGDSDLAAALLGTEVARLWASSIAIGWMMHSRPPVNHPFIPMGKIDDLVDEAYVDMAKYKSGAKRLPSLPLNSIESRGAFPSGYAPAFTWKQPNLVWNGDVEYHFSYSDRPQDRERLDALVCGLILVREKHRGEQWEDYREGPLSYRRDVEDCVGGAFPSGALRYVLNEGVPYPLRDDVADVRTMVFVRLTGAQGSRTESELKRFHNEALLLAERSSAIAANAPRPPLMQSLTFDSLYQYLSDLLGWCDAGLPSPLDGIGGPRDSASETPAWAPVVLQGRNRPALVNGKSKTINSARYDVIEALINAKPIGLTKDGLEKVRTDARAMLRKLRKDPDWAKVIHMAEMTSGRYRID